MHTLTEVLEMLPDYMELDFGLFDTMTVGDWQDAFALGEEYMHDGDVIDPDRGMWIIDQNDCGATIIQSMDEFHRFDTVFTENQDELREILEDAAADVRRAQVLDI